MRKTRIALLAALVSTVAAVVAGYYASQKRNLALAPARPAPLPADVGSAATDWSWSQSSKDRAVVEVRARDFRQIKDSTRFELGAVELKIFSKSGETYDRVRSSKAEFDQPAERLYSDGEVTIVLGLPAKGAPVPGKRYVEIRTSGLAYDNQTGISSTERPAQFQFENGEGRSTGAAYDSARRYLWMKSDVEVASHPASGAPMKIRAGELHYYEAEQKVELKPWSTLERGDQGVKAGAATVFLDQGRLTRVEAQQGQGWTRGSGRQVRFGADWMEVKFTAAQTVAAAAGVGAAELLSESPSGSTKASGNRMNLEFVTPAGAAESHLTTAYVMEQARVESVPAAKPAQPESRVLTAEGIKLVMRPGGEEVELLETMTPARLEFLPQQPAQWRRLLTADRVTARYRQGNRLETLRAIGQVHLRSEPPAALPKGQPRLTWSDGLEAAFDPQTGQMSRLTQWSNFRYQEGARQARSIGARFDLPADRISLDTAARVWDESGQTAAHILILEQREDKFHAQGDVVATHLGKTGGRGTGDGGRGEEGLFVSDRPVQATARTMDSEQNGKLLHYRGAARLWQEASSIQGEEIHLDRGARTLAARGGVVSVLVEEAAPGSQARAVTITADSLDYSDQDRRAHYRGNVVLRRERLTVTAQQLEAFLRPRQQVKPGQSRLERALASGGAEVREARDPLAGTSAGRRGSAEQAEYLAGEERVVLRGGAPRIEQPGRGATSGAELTYYLNDDRLLVSGQPGAPSQTRYKLKRN